MTDTYTPPTIANYNDNAPPDDGSQTAANLGSWAGVKNELSDPLKAYIDSVNLATENAFDDLLDNQLPANVKDPRYGAAGDGVTDDKDAIQACLNANNLVYFPPGVYIIDGQLTINDLNVLYGTALYGNSDTDVENANAKLVFTGTEDACIEQTDTATSLLHAGITGLTLRATGTYDWIVDLKTVVGLKLAFVRLETSQAATGGIRTTKINPGDTSWVLNWTDVGIRVPDGGTAYGLDLDTSDGTLISGNVTGGEGTILRGTGAMKLVGGRYDRSGTAGITISIETESVSTHQIIGCQIDENATYGILVDGDADDTRVETWVSFLITDCNFRNPLGSINIALVNTTGAPVLRGGTIGPNVYAEQTSVQPINYDIERWQNVTILPGTHLDPGAVHPRLYLGSSFRQPTLILAKGGATQAHSGAVAEETLATIAVPGNSMGLSGQLRIVTLWTTTNSANNKTLRVKFGGTTFTQVVVTTTATTRLETIISNGGSASSQVAGATDLTGTGSSTGAKVTASIDTTAAQNILITGELATGGEDCDLESWLVEVIADDS